MVCRLVSFTCRILAFIWIDCSHKEHLPSDVRALDPATFAALEDDTVAEMTTDSSSSKPLPNYLRFPDVTPELKGLVEGRTHVAVARSAASTPAPAITADEQMLDNGVKKLDLNKGTTEPHWCNDDRPEEPATATKVTSDRQIEAGPDREIHIYNAHCDLLGSVFIDPAATMLELRQQILEQLDDDVLPTATAEQPLRMYKYSQPISSPSESSHMGASVNPQRVPISTKQLAFAVARVLPAVGRDAVIIAGQCASSSI